MDRSKEKLEVSVSARLTAAKYRTLQEWCTGTYRKRSEVVGLVLERVLEILEQGGMALPVESFVDRLHVRPPL
jgi:hypothetical protein